MGKYIFMIMVCGLAACDWTPRKQTYDCSYCWYCEETDKTGELCCRKDAGVIMEKLDEDTYRVVFPNDMTLGVALRRLELTYRRTGKMLDGKQHFETEKEVFGKGENDFVNPKTMTLSDDNIISFEVSADSGGKCRATEAGAPRRSIK